jgi:RNA polymerase sigma-70 factor (ECF subfamily)
MGVKPSGPRTADAGTDAEAFVACVEAQWEHLRRIAWRFSAPGEAEDALQSAIASAWRSWAHFDERKGTHASWLATITLNAARKSWRGWHRHVPLSDLAIDDADSKTRIDLRRAIRRLPRRQAVAVELHYYVGLPVHEVAVVMGCAEGTVKSTLAKARGSLAEMLGEDYR